jgi:hypothetical protein
MEIKFNAMKKLFSLLFVLTVSVVCFAQEVADDTAQRVANEKGVKPVKFAGWSLSDAFRAEGGYKGSYWKPTFNIAVDKSGYYCIVNLYSQDDYITIDLGTLPHLYFKTDKEEIVDLEMDAEEPFHKFYLNGYYVGNVLGPQYPKTWLPGRYVTRLIFCIPDIDTFLSNRYVKYRIWLGESLNEGPKDVEFTSSYAKKFNKRLKEAADQAKASYGTKSESLSNPLEGF